MSADHSFKINARGYFQIGRERFWPFWKFWHLSHRVSVFYSEMSKYPGRTKEYWKMFADTQVFIFFYSAPTSLPDICLIPLYKTVTLSDKCPDIQNRQYLSHDTHRLWLLILTCKFRTARKPNMEIPHCVEIQYGDSVGCGNLVSKLRRVRKSRLPEAFNSTAKGSFSCSHSMYVYTR